MEKELVFFKSTKDGVQIVLDEEREWEEVLKRLQEKLESGAIFFVGSQVTVNLGKRRLETSEYKKLQDIISNQSGLTFLGIEVKEELSDIPAKTGIQIEKGEKTEEIEDAEEKDLSSLRQAQPEITATPSSQRPEENILLLKKTIRSGQEVSHPGSVIIIGDVNPGAEIKADGDVIILGALRGEVRAGINGNKKAVVCALKMQCHQIRIAQFVIPIPKRQDYKPEIAYIEKDKIILAPLETGAYKLEM